MAMALSSLLFFAWCQRAWTQAPLLLPDQDCFFLCWKTPGFCDACGTGNACCKEGDEDSDPLECQGPLTYTGSGESYECVVPSFQPGAAPAAWAPNQTGHQSVQGEAMCITYMSENGCGWTNERSCPFQAMGSLGTAPADDSMAYECCCTNGLWRESATNFGNAPRPIAGSSTLTQVQCQPYMDSTGCGWTAGESCPSQTPVGSQGVASNDGTEGYRCCCENDMWSLEVTTTQSPALQAGVGSAGVLEQPMAGVTATPVTVANAVVPTGPDSVPVASLEGNVPQTVPPTVPPLDSASNEDDFLNSHTGGNVHVSTVHFTDADGSVFGKHSEHHGPINNAFSSNQVAAKKEKCTFGICSDLDTNNPDTEAQAQTNHGVVSTETGPVVLPSYEVTVDASSSIAHPQMDVTTEGGGVQTGADVVQTTLSSPIEAGSNILPVSSDSGFNVGDEIVIGSVESHFITGENGAAVPASIGVAVPEVPGVAVPEVPAPRLRRLGGQGLVLDGPVNQDYPSGTPIVKVNPQGPPTAAPTVPMGPPPISAKQAAPVGPPAISAKAAAPTAPPAIAPKVAAPAAANGSSANSSIDLKYGLLIGGLLLCCCALAACGAAAMMMNRKKKGRSTTDREQDLKNDFIERQPINVPSPETEPMLKQEQAPMAAMAVDVNGDGIADGYVVGVDRNHDGIPDVLQGMPALAPVSTSYVQGMPMLGQTMPGTFLQPTTVAPQMYAPQTASMTTAMPYGNYASPSTYMSAPTAYSQNLGMTTNLGTLPPGSVY